MNKDWVWIVGGGLLQLPVIQEAQKRGLRVLVTDRNLQAIGCQAAEEAIELDTYDIAGHLALAHSLKSIPRAVLTDAADVGPTASILAEYYELPGCNYLSAVIARDKAQVRERLNQSHPVYIIGEKEDTPSAIWQKWQAKAEKPLPCVVKAADNCASRGQTWINEKNDFHEAVIVARHANHDSERIIVEEQLRGWEVALDFLVVADDVVFINGANRVFGKFGIEMGYTNPWTPPMEVQHIAEAVVDKLGVTGGPFKMDLLCDDRYGWCVLECATRWSGAFDHTHAARYATGRNLVKVVLDYALGLPIDREDLQIKKNDYCAGYTPAFTPGKISGWHLPPKNNTWEVFIRDSTEIQPLNTCADRPMFVLATGATETQAWDNAVRIGQAIYPLRIA